MAQNLQEFYELFEEPAKGCALYLRGLILRSHLEMTEGIKYGGAFFMLEGKNLCYIWKDKKTMTPYIGFIDGKLMKHPALLQEDRKRMKILHVNPAIDIDEPMIKMILQEAIALRIHK